MVPQLWMLHFTEREAEGGITGHKCVHISQDHKSPIVRMHIDAIPKSALV